MGADNSGGGTPLTPKQVESVMDVQSRDEKIGQILEHAQNALPSWANSPGVDAGIEASLKKSADTFAQNQYQQLSSDIETQAAPNFSGHNYNSYSATQLKQMVTTNMDPTTAGDGASAWTNIGNNYVTVAQGLTQAAGSSEYGWQGNAGDAARNFINGISQWAGTAGQGAQLAGNRLAVQSEAASTAKNSVPTNPTEPPTGSDVAQTMLHNVFNPAAGAAKLNAQFAQAAADHTEAVHAAQTYDTSLATSGEKFPAFNAPPAFNSSAGGGAGMPSSGGGGVSGLHSAGNVPRATANVRNVSSGSGAGGVGGSGVQAPVLSGAGTPNLSTGQSGFDSGPTSALPNTTTNPNGPVGNVPSQGGWNQGGWSSGQDPTFSGTLLGELGGPGGGAAGGLGAGAGAGALRGLSGGGAAGGAAGEGARSGVGAGVAGEEGEGAGGLRGGAAAGEPGESGMMPRGAGGKRGEDSEHRRPDYLLNPDPDATFGPDGYVAPPVIGE
jgi:hypothetical protein